MIRRCLIAALALVIVIVVPALAAVRKAPSRASVTAVDRPAFEPNRYLGDGLRWARDETRIKSGGTLTLRNRTRETHNFSIVSRRQVPRTARQVENCRICKSINDAHDLSAGPPKVAIVDKDGKGFNQPGDSAAFTSSLKLKVSAKPGRTLRFICAVHPWMQGKIVVR